MKKKLVTIARFTCYIEAELTQQRLEDECIKAVVTGQNAGNINSGAPAAIDIELQTMESVAERAREILESSPPQEQAWDCDEDSGEDEQQE